MAVSASWISSPPLPAKLTLADKLGWLLEADEGARRQETSNGLPLEENRHRAPAIGEKPTPCADDDDQLDLGTAPLDEIRKVYGGAT